MRGTYSSGSSRNSCCHEIGALPALLDGLAAPRAWMWTPRHSELTHELKGCDMSFSETNHVSSFHTWKRLCFKNWFWSMCHLASEMFSSKMEALRGGAQLHVLMSQLPGSGRPASRVLWISVWVSSLQQTTGNQNPLHVQGMLFFSKALHFKPGFYSVRFIRQGLSPPFDEGETCGP